MKQIRTAACLTVAALMAACAPHADVLTTEPTIGALPRLNTLTYEEQVYEAWLLAGSPAPEGVTVNVASDFINNNQNFTGSAGIAFNYYSNKNYAKITVTVTKEGVVMGTDFDEGGNENILPLGAPPWNNAQIGVTVSTNNNPCNVVGSANVSGYSYLTTIASGNLLNIWGSPFAKSAPPKTLPPCLIQYECNGYIVDDPSFCEGDEGEGGDGGGDGGGGGSSGGCEIYQFRLSRSWDEGATWEVVQVWYEYLGNC